MQTIMTRVFVGAALVLATGHAVGQEDFRVIGTLLKHQESVIEVESRDGRMTSIRLDRQTLITRNAEKVEAAELQVGLSVVVDAYGDSLEDLLALEIRIVPPIEN